ncbi:DUF6480 family protein [Streptomyces sp. NPDC055607]
MTGPSNPDPDPRDTPGIDVGGGTGTPRPGTPGPGAPGFGPGNAAGTPGLGAEGRTGAPGPGAEGGIAPGETPPAESGTGTGTGPYRPLKRGWATGPLLALWAVVIVFALFFLVYAIILATD